MLTFLRLRMSHSFCRMMSIAVLLGATVTAHPSPADAGEQTDQPMGGALDESALLQEYATLIQQKVTARWVRPASVPLGVRCRVQIDQLPGGRIVRVEVLEECPFDTVGRWSVKQAVWDAQPLPYQGYERVFNRRLVFNFVGADGADEDRGRPAASSIR